MDRIVVVGAGVAGFRVARSVRDGGFGGEVVLVGDERHLPYDRPPLSKQLLAGRISAQQCYLPGRTDDLSWRLGSGAEHVDVDDRLVVLRDGSRESFDELVIASGRRARPWPGPLPRAGVHTLRSLSDVASFAGEISTGSRVVVIGAGFIGCEVAATLRGLDTDVDVTVVDVTATPMPVLGAYAGRYAQRLHEQHGVQWRLATTVDDIVGSDRVTGVRLTDGELLPADVVLVAIGSLPNTEWLAQSPIDTGDGVVRVDRTCRVLDAHGSPVPGIWAAGDVAAWAHPHADSPVCVEHWTNARDMADKVAANIMAVPHERVPLSSVPSFWSDQYDVKIKSTGYLRAAEEFVVVGDDTEHGPLVLEARRGGDVVGAIGFNATKAILGYHRRLRAVVA